MAMTPQEQAREERSAALRAVEAALGPNGQAEVCREAVRRWPKFDGATAGDILEHTYDYDTFCAEHDQFYENNPGWNYADWGPAFAYALDALVLLGLPLDVPHVSKILQLAGVMEPPDDEPAYDPLPDVAEVLAGAYTLTSEVTSPREKRAGEKQMRDGLTRLLVSVNMASSGQAESDLRELLKGA